MQLSMLMSSITCLIVFMTSRRVRYSTLLLFFSILIHALLTGVETDYILHYLLEHTKFLEGAVAHDATEADFTLFRIADWIVLAWWIFELAVYVLAQGKSFVYPDNPMFPWNVFDTICVIFTIIELVA